MNNKIKLIFSSLKIKVLTLMILCLTAWGTMRVYSAFQEPLFGSSSSDQDFSQNILGANNADNDFDSSSVTANRDGSIIERTEYLINVFTGTCGNGAVEKGEACDDGGTSWTSGACAGDCSRRNYWSSPSYENVLMGAGTLYGDNNANVYCQERKFRTATSYATTTGSGLANFLHLFSNVLSTSSSTASASSGTQIISTSSATSFASFSSSTLFMGTKYSSSYSTILYSTNSSVGSNTTSSYFLSTWLGNGFRIFQTTELLSTLSGSTSLIAVSDTTVLVAQTSIATSFNKTTYFFSYSVTRSSQTLSNSYFTSAYYQETMQPSTSAIISEIWCAD